MVKMEETVTCVTRLFLWNEKLTRGQISESEGLCVFLIRTEFMRLNGCDCGDSDCDKLGERTCSTVIPFDVSKLLKNDPSLGTMLLSATLQFLPGTTEQLGNSISSYLFTRFQFSEALQLRPRPTYVIVLEFSHLRFIEDTLLDQVSLDDLPWVPPPIPSYCRFDKDWDEEEELRSMAQSVSPTDYMNDPYHHYSGDVLEYIFVLREYTGEGGICPTNPPIVSHIPRGLVEVKCFPFPLDQLNGSSRDPMNDDTCPVCYEEFKDKNEVLTTYCSHDFHNECLLIWLLRNNTCPVCRSVYPLHYSPILNRKRHREHNILEDNCKHHKHSIEEASA